MSFLSSLTARLPFSKRVETPEPFFALYIGAEKLFAALWTIEGGKLKILDTATDTYSEEADIIKAADRLLDVVVGEKDLDPQKILFGVPDSWLLDENLKENYLKLLRKLVKELELKPMAYVSSSNALVHLLESKEGVPTTAILVGLEDKHLIVTVARAGKLDGSKEILRSDDLGMDVEKVLLTFTGVEVLPSKILIYGLEDDALEKVKAQLLSFSWMSKLSFLHFPKIENLAHNLHVVGICFAGASEIDKNISYSHTENKEQPAHKPSLLSTENTVLGEIEADSGLAHSRKKSQPASEKQEKLQSHNLNQPDDFGFVVGDVADRPLDADPESDLEETNYPDSLETFEDMPLVAPPKEQHPTEHHIIGSHGGRLQFPKSFSPGFLKKLIPKRLGSMLILITVAGLFLLTIGAYLFLLKADIKVFVEPKIIEKDTQVVADPNIKIVQENEKKIPGQIVETEITGSGKGVATGKKQVGDPAKGTVKIINNSDQSQDFSKGTIITTSSGLKFTLDLGISIASTSATSESKSTKTVTATAVEIGADSNLPSGSRFTIVGNSGSQVAILSEGNFSGGNSKDVTVISEADQQKLIAQVSSDLRKSAQQKLQDKLPDKKVLEEALSETIVKKSFNKNINDQASELSLNLTARYKGTAYDDKDLRIIVSKLVDTETSSGFSLDLADTETQADVSKVEKDGSVVFLARFKAKLIPKLDVDKIKKEIKGKPEKGATEIIKGMENVLGSEIKLNLNLPSILRWIPFFEKNINIEVGLK